VLTSPRQHALPRNRWRLCDLASGVGWLRGLSVSGVWGVLRRLGFSRRQAQEFVRSPDPEFDAKWRAILQAYIEAWAQPAPVRLIFSDEVSYFRQPSVAPAYAGRGGAAPRAQYTPGHNTVTRIVAGLDATSGQVSYLARSGIEVGTFCAFLRHLREAYPPEVTLRLVLDNWSVHVHPGPRRWRRSWESNCCICPLMPPGSTQLRSSGAGCGRTPPTCMILPAMSPLCGNASGSS
jgi:hypothetical protein